MVCFSGSLPVSAKKAFCSARMVVSTLTLTWALSFFVSETYPLLAVVCATAVLRAARNGHALLTRAEVAAEAGCLTHRREACRNEEEALVDMFGDRDASSKVEEAAMVEAKYRRPEK